VAPYLLSDERERDQLPYKDNDQMYRNGDARKYRKSRKYIQCIDVSQDIIYASNSLLTGH